MPNILTRAISGAIYVALLLGCLILSPRVAFAILMLVFSIFGAIEYSRMTGSKSTLLRLFDIVATALPPFFVLMAVKATGLSTTTIAWGAGSVCFLYPFFRMGAQLYVKSPAPLEDAARGCLGVYYIGIALASAAMAAQLAPAVVILMFVMIWLNDTGAYLVGCRWGRTKLFERISPKKTWEGAAGGALFAMAAGVAAPLLPGDLFHFGSVAGLLLGLAVCVAGTIGDLVESMIKRQEGVKDSGNLIPGHGGILDRIDSLLFAAPVTLIFIMLILR
ncbi:MAG: phosphatidate cytidylyltransferase [Muribaculaceae bacterium]|jgi:phosphatidate cytidylyltransferase|nr:phosphatidate cytidylyltransferase [Muribaculaceae bacterium]